MYSLQALTKSLIKGDFSFIVHIKNEYDYIYESNLREKIFSAIKSTYNKFFGQNIAVYGVPENVKPYHTSKKDI